MYILGIGPGIKLGHQGSSAALLKDGVIIAACEEERFNNDKYARGYFPKKAIAFCLKQAGIKIQDVSVVASPQKTYPNYDKRIQLLFNYHFGYAPKVELFMHHLCHCASSYYVSDFNDSVVMSLDNSGDSASGVICNANGTTLEPIEFFERDHSFGVFYAMITQFLGFSARNDEYKVMGLASYGKPVYLKEMEQIIYFKDGKIHFEKSFNQRATHPEIYTTDFVTFQEQTYTEKLVELLGKPRLVNEEITQRHKDIAASLQKQLEVLVLKVLEQHKSSFKSNNFCFAGGTALNCKLNHEIIKSKMFKNVFIQPAADDAGIALGAALLAAVAHGTKKFDTKNIVYLGPEFSNEEIEAFLKLCKHKYKYIENPELTAAKLIAENKIVGWFQGRSEWGPRALGNRSILANPCNPHMKDIVNANIKFREDFRPFAPSVLSEYQDEFFTNCIQDPYMITLADAKPGVAEKIPSVVHFDGTARIQTVFKSKNPKYWALINHLKDLTGVPVVLNTSLNLNSQPLAARLTEATKTYFNSGIDCLILGNFLLQKEGPQRE